MKAGIIFLLLAVSGSAVAQQRKTENIIVVTMDGYRWQELFHGADSADLFGRQFTSQDSAWRIHKYWDSDIDRRRAKLMPFFWHTIAKQGQLYGNRDAGSLVNVTNTYWFSYPGYSELLTGYFDPSIDSNEYPDNPNHNVLEFINTKKGYQGRVAAFASWDALSRIINRNRNGILVNVYDEDVQGAHLTLLQKEANKWQHYIPPIFGQGERPDGNTYAIMKAYLIADHPKVVYLDFGDTDEYAHEGKYDYYLDAAHYSDAMLGDLWAYLQQDPFYRGKTAILISPDHGRGIGDKWTSHGSKHAPHSDETFLAVMGPDTPPLGEVKGNGQIYQNQYAKTIAALLGFDFTDSSHSVGKVISSVVKAAN